MIPAGTPTTVIKAIMMATGTTTKKMRPNHRLFQGDFEMVSTMALVFLGNRR